MTHIPYTRIHRFVGDSFTLRVPVDGLSPAQIAVASWTCSTVTKSLADGEITVEDDDGTGVLVVDVQKADTDAIGEGAHYWLASAGATDPPGVAHGSLELSPRS